MFHYEADNNFLSNKTILVTGASDGIGKCCAETFAAFGANVILLGKSQEKLEAIYDEIEAKQPGKVIIQPLDLNTATEADYQNLSHSLSEQFEKLDGLILNASILGARSPIEFYPSDLWHETMQVNVNSVFSLCKVLLPSLQQSEDARLIFTSSSVGRKGRAHWGAYAVSKFAVEGLMQTLAEELEKTSSIRVNSLNPGGTRTGMRKAAYPAEDPKSQPLPEQIMPVYLYLMSDEAKAIHGQAMDVRDFEPGKYLPLSN
jgi:NAD(P)-dependent dehydrogenase (short-subunit alcohol dehydrogenase family)